MLDTNICIYLIKGHPQSVLNRLAEQDFGDVVMSCLSLAQLRRGVGGQEGDAKKSDDAALQILLGEVIALDFDASAAHAFGVLGTSCTLKRNRAIDNLIAAHASSQQAVLVTNSEKDFKGYPGLKVENWV
jgi:tRNA(fMet)-specific endonuclease VapC